MGEHKLTEGNLRKEHKLVQAILDTTSALVVVLDPQGRIVRFNRACERTTGYSSDEIQGRHLWDLLLPAEEEQVKAVFSSLRDGQFPNQYENHLVAKDGRKRLIAWSNTALLHDDGSVEHVIGTGIDITERKQAEEEIGWQAKMLTALHEAALDLATQRTLPDLLEAVQARAVDLLGAAGGGIYIYRPVPDDLELVFQYNLGPGFVGTLLKRGEGLPGQVLESGQPMFVEACRNCENWAERCRAAGFCACVATPIFWGDQLLGTLSLLYEKSRTFTPAEVALLGRFTPLVAAALENARLYQEAHRRADRLALVNRVARAVSATLRLNDLMERVYQEVGPLFQTDAFCIAAYDQEADVLDLKIRVEEGVRGKLKRIAPTRAGLAGLVVRENNPLLIRNLGKEQNLLPQAQLWDAGTDLLSQLGVPMRIGERVVGVMCAGSYRSYAYGEEEQALLSTIADEVAAAVENARLFEAVEQQRHQLRALSARLAEAEESEVRRLAREVQDQVGQELTALGMSRIIVRTKAPVEAATLVGPHLDDSLALVEQTAERIRSVMTDLRPPLLDDYGLVAALHWYGAQFATRTGIDVHVEGEEPSPRPTAPVENALFRIAQEALTNVAKYAKAAQATVAVETEHGIVRLVVADDGDGFDPSSLTRPDGRQGWGLLSMAERAEALGGICRVESHPGQGTRIIAEVER